MYLTFAEYQFFGGTLDETTFNELEIEAEYLVNYHTFDRLKDDVIISDKVKYLVHKLVDLINLQNKSKTLGHSESDGNDNITSQSNDGVSIVYNGMKATEVYEACNRDIQKAIKVYLSGEKNQAGKILLYRGLYRGE